MSTTRRLVVAAVASVLVGVTTAGVAAASHGTPEDRATAQAGTVTPPDVPGGWTEDIGQNHLVEVLRAARRVKRCRAFATLRSVGKASPNAASSDFTNAGFVVSNDVAAVPSISLADETMDAYRAGATGQCLARVLPSIVKRDLARTGTVGSVTTQLVNAVAPTIPETDDAAGYRVLMRAVIDGKPVDVYVENWLSRVGRTLASYDFESRGGLFDAEIQANVVAASTARLAAATSGAPVAGESPYLARFLPTVSGYEYGQPSADSVAGIARFVADNAALVDGASSHGVFDKKGDSVAMLVMFEFKPDLAALPGFSSPTNGIAASDAQDAARVDNGGTGRVRSRDVDGTVVHDVSTSAGYGLRFFQCGRVEIVVRGFENRDVPAVRTDAYVDRLIRLAC